MNLGEELVIVLVSVEVDYSEEVEAAVEDGARVGDSVDVLEAKDSEDEEEEYSGAPVKEGEPFDEVSI